jgi:hypothetical protein
MRKVNRLGWTDGIAFTCHGVKVGVRTNNRKALKRIRDVLPIGWKQMESPIVNHLYSLFIGIDAPPPNFHRHHQLYIHKSRLIRTLNEDDVFDVLESRVRLTVAEFTKRRVFVHAGVVSWNNKAIVIPGTSNSGKTTLVTELVKHGARYYSDEYAVLDKKGILHPYAKPLSIRENGNARQTEYAVEKFGGVTGKKPLPIALVVVTDYKEGARWRPSMLSPGKGALEMLLHTVSARRQPEFALSTLNQVTSSALVLKGKRGEAKQTAEAILGMLS